MGDAVDEDLVSGMDWILELVEAGHSARNKAGLKVRQPLAELRIETQEADLARRVKPFLPLVLDELNVKAINFVGSGADLYDVAVRLDAKSARPKYGRYFNDLQQTLASIPAVEVEQLHVGSKDVGEDIGG